MVETFYDLDELETAVAAVRSVSALPIVALMTFDAGGRRSAASRRRRRGAPAAARRRRRSARTTAPGRLPRSRRSPRWAAAARRSRRCRTSASRACRGQRIVFPHATPAYFGEFAAQARALGARIIGGCCGTTPAQIAAIRAAVDEDRRPAGSFLVREREHGGTGSSRRRSDAARAAAREGEFVVSVQLDPPLGANPEALIETARAVRDSGKAQFVDVNDNPRARARMSGMMASVAIERVAGVETIPHLTPRDSTIAGLESLLLGAHAEGVRNILAVTGDPPEAGDYPGTARRLRGRRDRARRADGAAERGRGLPRPRDRRADVVLPRRRGQPDRRRSRARGGALPAQGRGGCAVRDDADPVRPRSLEAFRERIGGSPIPLLVGVWPIRTHERGARPQRGAGDRRPGARAGALPRARAPGRGGRGRARRGADRGCARRSRAASTSSRRSAGRSTSSSCCPSPSSGAQEPVETGCVPARASARGRSSAGRRSRSPSATRGETVDCTRPARRPPGRRSCRARPARR